MSGTLDLSNADMSNNFDAMDAGTYSATIFKAEPTAIKEGGGDKLPAGTPGINIQFRIEDEEFPHYTNRRAFTKFWFVPAEIDGKPYEHKAKMDGMLARFLVSIGYDEAEVKSGNFQIDYSDMEGRPCRVTLSKKQKYGTKPEDNEWDNEVKGVKPPIQDEAGIL